MDKPLERTPKLCILATTQPLDKPLERAAKLVQATYKATDGQAIGACTKIDRLAPSMCFDCILAPLSQLLLIDNVEADPLETVHPTDLAENRTALLLDAPLLLQPLG